MLARFLRLVCKKFRLPEQSCPGTGDVGQLSHQSAPAVFGGGGYAHNGLCCL